MARPTTTPLTSGTQGWDGTVDDNFDVLVDGPLPILEEAAITSLATLQATYPAASFDRCFIWINLTTYGMTLCWSDGTQWLIYGSDKRALRSVSATSSQVITDSLVRFTGAGTVDYDFLAAASWAGRTVTVRNDTAGVVSLDPNGSENINGSSTSLSLPAGSTATIYSTGTELLASIQT